MDEYPAHLAREHRLADGRRIAIRPIRPDDEPGERRFFDCLSPASKNARFMKRLEAINDQLIRFFTHIDYDRHMAFVCEHDGRLVGEARYLANPGGASCEFGVVVADDWRKLGIGALLMDALLRAARERGFATMEGLVLRTNRPMLRFVRALGFDTEAEPCEPTMVRVVKRLRGAPDYTASAKSTRNSSGQRLPRCLSTGRPKPGE
jgi:acetyltransferase